METNYIKTFFELEIKIINEKEFYYNGIQFINLNDFTKYLKNISNSYSEYILNKSLLLIDENRNIYLNHKISILKTHSESLNFIFDNFKINSTINAIKTPYSSILLDIKILKNQKQIDLFYEIYLQIKTISLKCIFDIASQLKNITPQQSKVETEQETPTFINNFNNISTVETYKHFKTGLVEKQYLTEQELNKYLKAAFELETIPETLFKIKDAPNKQKVMKVFYEYYKNIAGKPHGKQNKYAALLGDYFEGYNTLNVSTNFNK